MPNAKISALPPASSAAGAQQLAVNDGGVTKRVSVDQLKTYIAPNLSGTNTGDLTLAAVGSSPDPKGATLVGQLLTLQPADGSTPGLVTEVDQTFGGQKIFGALVRTPAGIYADAIQSDPLSFGALTVSGGSPDVGGVGNGKTLTLRGGDAVAPGVGSDADGGVLVLDGGNPFGSGGGGEIDIGQNVAGLIRIGNQAGQLSMAAPSDFTFASSITSGYQPAVRNLSSFSPPSGSGSFASLELNSNVNGVSSGKYASLAIASVTNTLTGGSIKLIDAGTSTQDYDIGFTSQFSVSITGQVTANEVTSFYNSPGSVATGHANFVVAGNPAASSPGLACFTNALEIGGRYPNAAHPSAADVYLGSMQQRTDGYNLKVLNNYGAPFGGTENETFAVKHNGDIFAGGNLYLGQLGTPGRVISDVGGMYLTSAGATTHYNTTNSGNIVDWYAGTGVFHAASLTSAGCLTTFAASGNDAIKTLDGARLNLSTADASAYFYRSAADTIGTPGKLTVSGGPIASGWAGPNVIAGTASFSANFVANSAPILANFGGATEIGGNNAASAPGADLYLGSMFQRNSGYNTIFLNNYGTPGGGVEQELFRVKYSGDVEARGNITLGFGGSSGRVLSPSAGLYLISNGPTTHWNNNGSGNIVDWYADTGGTLVSSVLATGAIRVSSYSGVCFDAPGGYMSSGRSSASFYAAGAGPFISEGTFGAESRVADGASALGFKFNNNATLTNVAAILFDFQNNGTSIFKAEGFGSGRAHLKANATFQTFGGDSFGDVIVGGSLYAGTGLGFSVDYSTCNVQSAGDIEVATIGAGFVLKSPNGTRYRITVSNGGVLSAVAA